MGNEKRDPILLTPEQFVELTEIVRYEVAKEVNRRYWSFLAWLFAGLLAAELLSDLAAAFLFGP